MGVAKIKITLYDDDSFRSVIYNGTEYNLADWNKQFTSLNTESGESTNYSGQ